MRVYNRNVLVWDGPYVRLNSGRLLATLKEEDAWPGLWRASLCDGHITDMVNLARAKDAAEVLSIGILNRMMLEAAE